MTVTGNYSDQPFSPKNKPVYSTEAGIYAEDTWQALDALKMNAGFRLSYFQSGGQTYIQPEPRFSAALKLASDFSAKLSYAKMNQYVHLLSNTGLGLSTDLWVTSTERIRPQQSSQYAFGFAKDLEEPALTFTLEGFYKKMNSILSYKEGATFLGIDGANATEVDWQDNVTSGKGWSYGAEFLAQKKSGRLSGWVGYTLSWINWQFPELNEGKVFRPRYDRRHDVSVVGIYELTKGITVSATWVYGTGNAYNRKNPFFYDMTQDEPSENVNKYSLKKYSLFPVLPSVSYNFKF
jgi:hypothetical protein